MAFGMGNGHSGEQELRTRDRPKMPNMGVYRHKTGPWNVLPTPGLADGGEDAVMDRSMLRRRGRAKTR